ncbi:MAG: nicotinate-nucleotide adenylyltransferase, partial [Clostridia bacterium]|nr:nicotinate-nucleotide adenylyltransferase [Clostridia bacterium]
MTIFTVDKLRQEIMLKLSGKRLSHVLSVEKEIEWLGKQLLPYELLRLKTAALLHDNTKDIPDSEQAALCD